MDPVNLNLETLEIKIVCKTYKWLFECSWYPKRIIINSSKGKDKLNLQLSIFSPSHRILDEGQKLVMHF